jgi:aspartate/methionine/tyrosine aminotransferase
MNSYSFTKSEIPFSLLKSRAFNLRWAEQEDGVIPLTAADPDFPAAPQIREALSQYALSGVYSYAPPFGLPAFRQGVARWFQKTRGIPMDADQVMATDSVASGMWVVAKSFLSTGDEVLIPDPVDFLFEHTIRKVGALPVRIPMKAGEGPENYIKNLQARIGKRTRMIWLCNPHNPLGLVPTTEWLAAVAEWAVQNGLMIVSDEIWSDIVYAPHRFTTLSKVSTLAAQHSITLYGFSKNFALAGLRMGCILTHNPDYMAHLQMQSDARSTVYGAATPSQIAALAGMEEAQDWLAAFVAHLTKARNYACQRLQAWPRTQVFCPEGTYVIFPYVGAWCPDVEALCDRLQRDARVALVPGAARWFGPGAQGHLRICFATALDVLEEAFDRLEAVVLPLIAASGGQSSSGDALDVTPQRLHR